jgi:hypothetical protein
MSDPLQEFERLAAEARKETVPVVDVSERVVQTVRVPFAPPQVDWPLWISAGLSVAAAIIVMLIAVQSGAFTMDPFAELVSNLTPVIQ